LLASAHGRIIDNPQKIRLNGRQVLPSQRRELALVAGLGVTWPSRLGMSFPAELTGSRIALARSK
jgi:hypothetical protein